MNMNIQARALFILSLMIGTGLNSAAQNNEGNNSSGNKDFYTQIADRGQEVDTDRPMEKIEATSLPADKTLRWSGSQKYRFLPLDKISDKKEMTQALKELRSTYEPFLRDLAPEMETVRTEFRIDSMSFRYETEEDRTDFNRLLQGKGDWEIIGMPFYHGPQGPSTAWYRKEIEISDEMFSKPSLMVHFNGSDYYTDVFINGHHVGSNEGMLNEFEFNFKAYSKPGKNVLLVKVRNDYSMLGGEGSPRRWGNKLSASNSPGWDDPFSGWSCCPTGYGIYQDIYIIAKGSPRIADVFCRPLLRERAVELWVETDLEDGDSAGDFKLKYSLFGQNFQTEIVKGKTETLEIVGGRVLTKIKILIPSDKLRLWTPQEPWLYQIQVTLSDESGKEILDTRKQQFGMRQFDLRADSEPKGRMYLNGKEIRLRGANTMGFLQQSVMKHDWDRLTDDLLLAKLTNMNFIRTTQRIMPKEVYDYADRLGMMMQSDLPLFAYINQKQYTEILRQASGIERVLRNHPSVIMLSYLNEPMAESKPHAISRFAYERLFDALDIVVHNENPERAIKYVDGDYQAPSNGYPDNHCYNIWYDKHGIDLKEMRRGAWMPVSEGWMFGCGEFGAEGLDPVDLMERRYPEQWLQAEEDGTWSPKRMRGIYSGEQTYSRHWSWFETEYSIKDWVAASQQHQEWGVSTVARAFRRMPRMNSFAVHLFIDAWPNGWMKAIMDCERSPKPAWFAYRDALTPLSVQVESERTAFFAEEKYSFQIWVCNDTDSCPEGDLRYQLELNGKVVDTGTAEAEIPSIEDAVAFQGFLPVKMPSVKKKTRLTVRASLIGKNGSVLHEDAAQVWVYPKTWRGGTRIIGTGGEADYFKTVFSSESGKRDGDSSFIVLAESPSIEIMSQLKTAVSNGASVLCLRDAVESEIIKTEFGVALDIKPQDSWVLFRNRSHAWVQETEKRDLFYCYSSTAEAPARFDFAPFSATGFDTVLYFKDKQVLAEKKDGKGRWILCSLSTEGMLDSNPPLLGIFRNMLSLATPE